MKKRSKWIVCLSLLLAAVMLLSPLQASAASSDALKQQLDELEAQNDALQEQLDALEQQKSDNLSEIEDVVAQKNTIDQQVSLLHTQISNLNAQIADYNQLIADKQDELDAAEQRLDELSEKNKERIRAMEEEGSLSYWSVLFKASSFSDLLDRVNMIEEIAAADQRRLQEMSEAAEAVAAAKDALAAEKAELEDSKQQLDDAQDALEVKRAEADELLTELVARGEEYQALLDSYEEEQDNLLADIAAKEQEYNQAKEEERQAMLAAQAAAQQSASAGSASSGGTSSGAVNVGSGWIVPCSYVYVSSPYGYRVHPIHGYTIFHSGIDLAAYQGVPIYASRGGTVTAATYDSAAGYYVTINHGDGYSSSYLHMTHYVVGVGQSVNQGELIGYVGSTGGSTGPHLHFSIYYNGSSVNPANYINF